MSAALSIRNRQRLCRINTPLLRRITLHVLRDKLKIREFELGILLVGAAEMSHVNHTFLQHDGSTDVITFDYLEFGAEEMRKGNPGEARASQVPSTLHGDIFICLDDAVRQAREFRTTWHIEVVRYVIHGLLHLCGHDDQDPASRRMMKREENRWLRESAEEFPLKRLGTRNVRPRTARGVS